MLGLLNVLRRSRPMTSPTPFYPHLAFISYPFLVPKKITLGHFKVMQTSVIHGLKLTKHLKSQPSLKIDAKSVII